MWDGLRAHISDSEREFNCDSMSCRKYQDSFHFTCPANRAQGTWGQPYCTSACELWAGGVERPRRYWRSGNMVNCDHGLAKIPTRIDKVLVVVLLQGDRGQV
jgi:hypothetical protein